MSISISKIRNQNLVELWCLNNFVSVQTGQKSR